VAEVVGAHVRLGAVGHTGGWQTQHAGVVHQYINGLDRVGERAHTGQIGQIGQIEVAHLDVAGHLGGGLLRFRDGPTGNQHV
jgi:hypothetical protein